MKFCFEINPFRPAAVTRHEIDQVEFDLILA
jgi:hypothetical protein